MEKTKENLNKESKRENSKGKHKTKLTIGDIIFRVLVILAIFFSVIITYISYLQNVKNNSNYNNNITQQITETPNK